MAVFWALGNRPNRSMVLAITAQWDILSYPAITPPRVSSSSQPAAAPKPRVRRRAKGAKAARQRTVYQPASSSPPAQSSASAGA